MGLKPPKISLSIIWIPVVFCWFVSYVVNQKNGWQDLRKCKQRHSLGISPKPNTSFKILSKRKVRNWKNMVGWKNMEFCLRSLLSFWRLPSEPKVHLLLLSTGCDFQPGRACLDPMPVQGNGTRSIWIPVSYRPKKGCSVLSIQQWNDYLDFHKRLFYAFL